MDQVKVYLGIAKKYHFWILTVVVLITGVVVWLKASSALAAKYDQDKKTITGAETAVNGANSPDNPNPQFTKKVEGLHEGLKKQVFDAWEELYKHQVGLFKWPELELKPTVDLNLLGPNEEIPEYVRVFYNERVVEPLWQDLLAQVDLRRPKEASENSSDDIDDDSSSRQSRAVEYEGLVVWKEAKRKAIVDRYRTENSVPSSAKMRLIQEDVFLFDSLIKIINAVNRGATDSLKAPIKEIDTLDIAQWAVAASLESGGTIWTKGQAASGGAGTMGGMGAMPGGMGGMTAMPGGAAGAAAAAGGQGAAPVGGAAAVPGGAAGAAAANNDTDWFEGRFLDEKGQPLKGGKDAPQPFAEFRQMFVYMKLIMDQRQIPNLIAACANAELPIETRQVKVQLLQGEGGGGLFGDGGAFGAGGMGPGAMMMGPGAMGPMGPGAMGPMGPGAMTGPMGPGMGGPDMAGGAMSGASPALEGGVETTVFDVVVELSGVIYLYNPPDVTKLGTGAAASPEKRSFGVPTSTVKLPVAATGSMTGPAMGPSMGPTATPMRP